MATVTLRSGAKMPLVGLGLWKIPNETAAQQVYDAIKTGYRLLDSAADYGNEKEAGLGIKRAIDEGLVKRSDIFVTSKLWNSFHDPQHVGPIARKQLKDLGLDYFDLFLIHFPIALKYVDPSVSYPPGWGEPVEEVNAPLHKTYEAMEKLVDEGLAKNIGVSNYQSSLLLDTLRYARIKPAVLQIEHHPYLTQEGLVHLAKQKGIAVTAYSSFGPSSFLELELQHALDTPLLLEHDVINSIAKNRKKSPAQILLRWATQRGIAVVPKSSNPKRLAENLRVTDFDLTKDELAAISALNFNKRFNDPAIYLDPPIHIFD